MAEEHGWVAYGPSAASPPPPDEALRPELADVGRLARRGLRAVVGAARAAERPRLSRILGDHLGPGATTFDVVEETWPGYDHVNVQAGLDAWLADARRSLGTRRRRRTSSTPCSASVTCSPPSRDGTTAMGLQPGNPATRQPGLRTGRRGPPVPAVRDLPGPRGGRADGAAAARRRTRVRHRTRCPCRSSAPTRRPRPGPPRRSGPASVEHNVFRGQVLSFGQEVFGHGQTLLQFHRRPTHDRRAAHPAAGDARRGAAAGRRGGPPQGAAARRRPAPQARAAALRAAG